MFGNLANVYELLRRRGSSVDEEGEGGATAAEDGSSRRKDGGANRISDSERAMLPFEGKLLMFRRGNGVEETKGRLLLKKLDYLQVVAGLDHSGFCFSRLFHNVHSESRKTKG